MKAYIGKYVMTALSAAVLAAGTLPVSAQYRVSPQTQQYAEVQDAAVSDTLRGAVVDGDSVYTIERCYTLVEENYPLVRRYGLLDLTEEFTLKNAYGCHRTLAGALGRRHDSGQPGQHQG